MAKRSKTYNRLKPFIVETIANTRARGSVPAGGTGGGGAGVTDHGALTGLTDTADHPGYLLISGGRALEGNMAVNSGVTIDGVDLSAPTQGITLSGSSYILASTVGGDGLTYTAGVLAVGVANTGATGLSVEANAVRLTSSTDVGTTPAAAILASTAAGAVTLKSLTTKGNVDITTGGDLTVGSNVLFVDTSAVSVGIDCAPDPQFALDVNGPIRGQYFIGPHAIQIKDAIAICHFDGPNNLYSNYQGQADGHMGQIATLKGGAVFRPGKFQKALQTGVSTTNLLSNPSFEGTYSSGVAPSWTAYSNGTAAGTRAETTDAYVGSKAQRLTRTGGAAADRWGVRTTSAAIGNTSASMQVRVKVLSYSVGAIVRLYCDFTGGPFGEGTQRTITSADVGEWLVLYDSAVVDSADTCTFNVWIEGANADIVIDAAQLEGRNLPTPYFDGSLGGFDTSNVWRPEGTAGSGHAWTGTVGASTSTRASTQVVLPTVELPLTGTVMAWVCSSLALYSAGAGEYFYIADYANTAGIILYVRSSGSLGVWCGGSNVINYTLNSGNFAPFTWHHVAVTWDYGVQACKLYLDGVEVGSGGYAVPATDGGGWDIGSYGTGGQWSGWIDDWALIGRAITAIEARTIYESNAPVFAETSRFNFRATSKQLVWADDEGLWMRDATGNPVLGVYGGDAASKSWASLTLAPGDVVIGDGASSYFLWDDSAGTLKLNTVSGADTAYMLLSGFYLDMYDASVRRFRFDGDLGKVTIGQVASGKSNVYISDNIVSLSVYTTDKVVLSATGGDGGNGYIQVGQSGSGQNNVYVDNAGLKMRTGTTANLSISTAGVITVGEVDTGKSNVLISSGAVKLRNNTTDVITLLASPGTQNTLAKFDGSIEVAANVFAGSYNVRMGTDGHRLVLPSSASLNISSSSSAIRWFPAIDSTPGTAVDYAGQVAYINTGGGGNVLDGLFTAYVGSTNYTTRDARIGMQAGHSDGTTYTDCYLLIVREKGSGKKYGLFVGDEFDIDGTLYLKSRGSAPTIPTSEQHTYFRNGKFVIAYNDAGTTKYRYLDLTSTNATWTYTTTAP